jgi:hypothetical protein
MKLPGTAAVTQGGFATHGLIALDQTCPSLPNNSAFHLRRHDEGQISSARTRSIADILQELLRFSSVDRDAESPVGDLGHRCTRSNQITQQEPP